jgi:Fic family protein
MNLKDFKAGIYHKQYNYKSFLPEKVNHTWLWDDPKINVLLESATRSLGELNAFSLIVPDIDLFIQMHIVKEAQASSKIEGTNTNIDEVLMDKNVVSPEKRDDWQEVQNYVKAMNFAVKELERLPLSNRLLKEMHKILLTGARGEHKSPGDFRRSQNWIGGSNPSDAVFIPPSHEQVPDLMSDFEHFLHNDQIDVPHLIKVAIGHYQFETIHPFLDGNGRIGRLLITFYLVANKLLIKPSLYLSDFFERNRTSYYDALSRVRTSNDLTQWVKFFLNGIITTAEKGKATFHGILKLKNDIDAKIVKLNRKAERGRELMNLLYRKPIIKTSDAVDALGITPKSAIQLIADLQKMKILHEMTGFKRNRVFIFKDYLKLF